MYLFVTEHIIYGWYTVGLTGKKNPYTMNITMADMIVV